MPLSVVKSKKDEAKWKKAEDIAAKSGQEGNYAYVMGIYKKMKPDYKFKKTSSVILRAAKKGNGNKNFVKIAKEDRADVLKAIPGIAGIAGAGIGYRNPDLFDPSALFPGIKSGTKRAKMVSALLGAGTAATTAWLPAAMRDTYREGKKLKKSSIKKTAAIGQKSTATQDFLGGFDPTGSFTGSYGLANQARGKTKKEHRKSKGLAITGGAIGSGVALPAVTTGLISGVKAGIKAKGGAGAKLLAGAKGFAKGTTTIPKSILGALKIRSIGNKAIKNNGHKLSGNERKTIMDVAGSMPIKNLLPKKGGGEKGGPGVLDGLNLLARNKVSKKMGKKLKSEASTGLKAGLGGIALGAGIGGLGASIQYDKGRKSYEDTVNFARKKNEV